MYNKIKKNLNRHTPTNNIDHLNRELIDTSLQWKCSFVYTSNEFKICCHNVLNYYNNFL